MSGNKNDNKVDWTQEAKARVMAANAKSGGDAEFARKAQGHADKAEHAKNAQAGEQGKGGQKK